MFNVQCSILNPSATNRKRGSACSTAHVAHRTSHIGSQGRRYERRRGFTLTELLVVIGIIALLLAVGIPSFKAMFASSRLDSAYTLVSSAVSAARSYAPRKPLVGPELEDDGMGAAAVFIQNANGQIEVHIAEHRYYSDATASQPAQAVYSDVIDPVILGQSVGVAGITRSSGSTQLIAPPKPSSASTAPGSPYGFAIRFDINGALIPRNPTIGTDNKADVLYNVNPVTASSASNKQLTSVIGVIIFDKQAFANQFGAAPTGTLTSEQYTWVTSNGTPMLFNRYTGAVMKEQ